MPDIQEGFSEALFDRIADGLAGQGYIVLPDCLPASLVTDLQAEFERPDYLFKHAGIGRAEDYTRSETVRGDRICWLEGVSDAPRTFLAMMETLRQALNRRLFLGLFDYESHLACYPPGSFYKKHVDAFRGSSNRVLSTVAYLNSAWNPANGGELVIYDDADAVLTRVIPEGGKLVIFLSERFVHEVLPAKMPRYSVAGWFRVNTSGAHTLDPPA